MTMESKSSMSNYKRRVTGPKGEGDIYFLVKELGFEFNPFNPYDKYVVNKSIDGKQCSIIWHWDDLMLIHVNQELLVHILSELTVSKKFVTGNPLLVHTGEVHDYVGTTIDFSSKGKVVFRMVDYV
jgi:hypothetical protein